MSCDERVSIVVPSFNHARVLREALDSVLAQDYPNLEVVVMDGGSTDGTVDILRSYANRLSFVSGADGGQADAINRGWARTTGSIVAWLNSDDRYVPGAVRKAVEALRAHPQAAMVYGEGELIDEGGSLLGRFPFTQPFDLWTLMHVSDFILQPTVFMRREPVLACGGLQRHLRYGLDWDLWIRLGCRWPIAYLPDTLAQAREHGHTKTATGGFRRLWELGAILAEHGVSRWSPAGLGYGVDTLRRSLPRIVGRWPPTALGRLLRPLRGAAAAVVGRRLHHGQGVFRDGWIAPRAFCALPWDGAAARLEITGELVADHRLIPCRIEVRAAGEVAAVIRRKPGAFRLHVRLPDRKGSSGGPLDVELRSSARRHFAADGRTVSCLLHEVTLVPEAPANGDAMAVGWSPRHGTLSGRRIANAGFEGGPDR